MHPECRDEKDRRDVSEPRTVSEDKKPEQPHQDHTYALPPAKHARTFSHHVSKPDVCDAYGDHQNKHNRRRHQGVKIFFAKTHGALLVIARAEYRAERRDKPHTDHNEACRSEQAKREPLSLRAKHKHIHASGDQNER